MSKEVEPIAAGEFDESIGSLDTAGDKEGREGVVRVLWVSFSTCGDKIGIEGVQRPGAASAMWGDSSTKASWGDKLAVERLGDAVLEVVELDFALLVDFLLGIS